MDYYKRLGINKNASQDEIKKAYRNLAKTHHPDRGGNQKMFQQINEAYDTLKDPQKKAAYDNPQPEINMNSQNFEDVFSQFFGGRMHQRQQRNKDIKIGLNLTLEEVATGKDVLATYRLANGQETSASLRIHPGVQDGQVIRYKGLGDNTYHQIPRGDLQILCRVKRHKRFTRDRHHLKTTIDVSIFELVVGTTYIIDNLTGGQIRVSIPKNTNPGTILSIAGYGLPDPATNRQGNLYVTLKGIIPKMLPEQIERVQKLNDELSTST